MLRNTPTQEPLKDYNYHVFCPPSLYPNADMDRWASFVFYEYCYCNMKNIRVIRFRWDCLCGRNMSVEKMMRGQGYGNTDLGIHVASPPVVS